MSGGRKSEQTGDRFHLHKRVKEIAGIYNNPKIRFIKDVNNQIILDTKKLLITWREYLLFHDDKPGNPENDITTLSGPSILKSEIKHAITV